MISVVYCGIWCHKRDLNEFKLNYLFTTARMLAFIHYTWLRCKIKESNLQCEFVENVIKSEAGKSELKYNPVSFFFYWLLKVCACNSAGVISLYGYFSKSWGGYRIHKECAQNLEITTVLVNFNSTSFSLWVFMRGQMQITAAWATRRSTLIPWHKFCEQS